MESTIGRSIRERDVLAIGSEDVSALLRGREIAIVETIAKAYQAHGKGQSSLPHSTFLRFPDQPANRIIALPAYLGGEVNSAGMKWIASFPGNLAERMDRASAVIILNSIDTGRPKVIMEGSVISAKRTAASAALAAKVLDAGKSPVVGMIGCGLINVEVARFLTATCPQIHSFVIYDLDQDSAHAFQVQLEQELGVRDVRIANRIDAVLESTSLISFATTASKPHVQSLESCSPGTVVLHVSLRDLSPDVILSADNIVDDIDHVCRAQTSIHLAEQKVGHRNFVRCTLAEILNGEAPARQNDRRVTVFSPFGLGILDVALGEQVYQDAMKSALGFIVPSFIPESRKRVSELLSA